MSDDFARKPEHPIHDQFHTRWSRRSFTGEAVAEADLHTIFEAARWAPSSSNLQPWRFVYAKSGTPDFEKFVGTLMPFNQPWARKAGVLIAAVSHTKLERNGELLTSPWHAFDTGAAWQNLALQAASLGYNTRAMGGFFQDKAREALKIPADYEINALIALGKPGTLDDLPADYHSREVPTQRKPLGEVIFEGSFPG